MKKKCLILSAAVMLCVLSFLIVKCTKTKEDDERQQFIDEVRSQVLPESQENNDTSQNNEASTNNDSGDISGYNEYADFDKKLEQKIKNDIEKLSWTDAYADYDALSDEQKAAYAAIPSKYKVSIDALDDIVASQKDYDLDEKIKKNEIASQNNPKIVKYATPNYNRINSGLVGSSGVGSGDVASYQDPSQPINAIVEYDDDGLPKNYDLRNLMEMSIDDQKQVGLCWDFASTNSLETYLYLHEGTNMNLSEVHANVLTSQFFYGVRRLDDGGTFDSYLEYLALSGVALEQDGEFDDSIISKYYKGTDGISAWPGAPDYEKYPIESYYNRTTIDTHITKTVDFPTLTADDKETMTEAELKQFRAAVKRHIIANGSLYFTIRTSSCVNSDAGYIYCKNPGSRGGHAMSIIGWIDDFDTSVITDAEGNSPEHNGVYVVKNSWGEDTDYSHGQYLYMPYDYYDAEADLHGIVSNSIDDALLLSEFKGQKIPELIRTKYNQYINEIDGQEYILKSLINIYNTDGFTAEDYEDLALFGDDVVTLNIANYQGVDIEYLKKFPNTAYIELDNVNELSNEVLEYIASKARHLTIKNTKIASSDFLSNLDSAFWLEFVNVGGLNLNMLPENNNLSFLRLDGCIDAVGLDKIHNYSHLNDLELLSMNLSSVADLGLADNYGIYRLSLAGNKMTDFSGLPGGLVSLDLSDNSLTNYPTNLNVAMVTLRSNSISELKNLSPETSSVLMANNQTTITSIDVHNPALILDIQNSEISSFEIFDGSEMRSLQLTNNNISTINEINADIMNVYILNNPISDDVKNLRSINGLISVSLKNTAKIDVAAFDDFEELKSITLEGMPLKGRYSGGAMTLMFYDTDLSNVKLSSSCELSTLNLGVIAEKDLRRMKSYNAMSPDDYSRIIYSLPDKNITFAELERIEEKPEYSFYYTDGVISPTQIVYQSTESYTIDVPVAVGQSEYVPTVMTKLQQLIFHKIGMISAEKEDFRFSKNSIIALDGSLGGKEFTVMDISKYFRYFTIRFVETN